MKVLEIGLDWFPEHGGGLDRYFYDLVAHASRSGLHIEGLVAGSAAVAASSDGMIRSFAPRAAPLPRRFIAARRATRHALDSFRPDLVAGHFAAHLFPSLDLIRRPLVVHFQGPWAQESHAQGALAPVVALKHRIEATVLRRANRCIVLSQAFSDLLCRDYGVAPDRVRVVPGSVDVERFAHTSLDREAARARLGWPGKRPTLLAVRRLVRRMGLDQLIDAVARIVPQRPDLLLAIAGRGPEEATLRARIAAAGLDAHVRLLGYVSDDDLPITYRAANLTIVPTETLEGFGLITAEALAAGTPVMVTPVGGLPEAVAPLAPGLVLAGTGAAHLADGIGEWLDGRLGLPSAAACVAYARERFSWTTGIARVTQVYAEAIEAYR